MKFSKKILAAVLAALMAISMMPFTASAASKPYLTFTGTDSFSIKTNNSKKNWNGTLEYSTDANTWTTWNGTSQISSDNNVLYLRGTGNTQITGNSISKYWVITTEGTVACSGDIRTLLDYADPESSDMGAYCFYYLFRNCTSLTAAPELPATILETYCYYSMFNGCTSLTTAPELPATALAQYCYAYMFNGCANLTTAPELPATTLAQYCYSNMFNGCRSLTTAPKLPATSLARSCYLNMFNFCTSLTKAPKLPATTLESNCYCNMFYDCKSLTTAPELPATTLAEYCYCNMFNGCTSLTTPSELPAIDLADGCYQYMFRSCTGIKLSTEQTAEYSIPYSIPKEGTGSMGTEALDKMFTGTGGTFTGTPTINTTYYIPAPAPTEPATTVSFTKVSSADEITAENICTCTKEEAATWILANWDSIEYTPDGFTYFFYYSDNSLCALGVYDGMTKAIFEQYYSTADFSVNGIELDFAVGAFNAGSNVYLCTPAAPEPTSTVSFTKVTEASQITAENISTCTVDEAAAWIVANWDDIFDGEFIDVAYYNSSTGCLDAFSISSDNNKKGFEDNYENFIYSDTSADNIKNWFEQYGDTVYLCTAAAPAPAEPVASVNGVLYADLEEAIAAAQAGGIDTVTLVNDVDLTAYPAKGMHRIDITGVTIDLDQHKITASGRWGVLFEGTNATIKNGTMEAIDNSDAPGYQYGVYVWGRDGSDDMPDPAQKASVTLENLTVNYGIHTYNAEVTVKDCDVTGSSKYYAIWADCESTVNVESGNFTTGGAAVVGTAQYQNALFGHINVEGGNFTVPAGKKLVQTGSSCVPANTQFSGGTVKNANGSVYTILAENLAPHFVQDMTTGGVYQGDANNGTSITVADTISENFYLDDEFYGENAYIAVNYNHNSDASQTASFSTDTMALSSLDEAASGDYAGNRIFHVTQAPAQSTEPITITVYANQADALAGTNAVDTITYSVYDYCRAIITGEYADNVKDLAKATLDYSAAAQDYFDYNTSDMATKDATGDFYGDVAGANLSSVAGIATRPGCIKKVSVVVKSDLEINLLSLTPIDVVNGSNIETDKGGTRFGATSYQNGDYYVVHIKGIEPANMDNTITVKTTEGDIVLTANAIMKLMTNSGDAKLVTLAKAMYLYGVAANANFA